MTSNEPTHRIVQLSDLHLTSKQELLHGAIDADAHLLAAFDRVAASGLDVDAFIASGDLADAGAPDAYQRLRTIFDEQSQRFGRPILSGMGNHDSRETFREFLLGSAPSLAEVDTVTDVRGLRIIHLDSSVPGAGHGDLTDDQVTWLRDVLSSPAEHGSVLVVHHPPVPNSSELLQLVDFRSTDALARAIDGTDVRVILSGHWHCPAVSALNGVPVVIAGAVAYGADPATAGGGYRGTTAGYGFTIVELYADQVLSLFVPIQVADTLYEIDPEQLRAYLAAQAPAAQAAEGVH